MYKITDFDYITSDSHVNHQNIVDYCYRPGWFTHDYLRHNEIIQAAWAMLPEGSRLLHLGDFGFRHGLMSEKQIEDMVGRLDVTMILGNHDKGKKHQDWLRSLGIKIVQPFHLHHKDYQIFFDHYARKPLEENQISVHGHNHGRSVEGRTKRHQDVSCDLYHLSPIPFGDMIGESIYRATESVDRDFRPKENDGLQS